MAKKPPKAKPGPTPDVLKLEDDWEAAMKKSLAKKKPKNGWPDSPTASKRKGK